MSDPAYKELALGRYQNLLELAVGHPAPMALCDHGGALLWSSDDGLGQEFRALLAGLRASGFVWESDVDGQRQRAVEGDRVLLYHPVEGASQDPDWLVLLLPRAVLEASAKQLRGLRRALETTAACVEEEARIQLEASGLAAELSRRYEELNLVYVLDELTGPTPEVHGNLRPLLRRIGEHMDADLAVFVARGLDSPMYAAAAGHTIPNLDLVLVEIRGDLFRFVSANRKVLLLNHPQDPRRQFLFPHLPYKFLACPISRRDFQGMLVLVRQARARDFENSDRSLAQVVAEQIGTLMRSERIVTEMRQFGEQLAGTLIEAVEAKDPYTRGHSERVQAISVQIGRALHMDDAEVSNLYWGALMHDVGKIGIPDMILSKPGALTDAEYTFIKTHPERSYEILRHIRYLTPACLEGARYHHEKYDGSGYPNGLRGRAIPMTARIIAVADAYDAMTSSRSYRSALTHDEAMTELKRCSGTQLDAEIVDAFRGACRDDMRWLEKIIFREERGGD